MGSGPGPILIDPIQRLTSFWAEKNIKTMEEVKLLLQDADLSDYNQTAVQGHSMSIVLAFTTCTLLVTLLVMACVTLVSPVSLRAPVAGAVEHSPPTLLTSSVTPSKGSSWCGSRSLSLSDWYSSISRQSGCHSLGNPVERLSLLLRRPYLRTLNSHTFARLDLVAQSHRIRRTDTNTTQHLPNKTQHYIRRTNLTRQSSAT